MPERGHSGDVMCELRFKVSLRPAIHYPACMTGTPEQACLTGTPDSVCREKLSVRPSIRPPDAVWKFDKALDYNVYPQNIDCLLYTSDAADE